LQFQPTKLVLYAWAIPPVISASRVIVYNLAQLGIEVDVRYFEPTTVIEKAGTPGEPVDLVMMAWNPDYADGAAYFVPLLGRGSSSNVVNLEDHALDRRMSAANGLTGEARRRAWAELDIDLMRDNPPWAPFLHTNHRAFISPSLGCFLAHPLYRVDLAALCKKR
jgi:ABC-type oligopeptide transport system substrate-binding subunit